MKKSELLEVFALLKHLEWKALLIAPTENRLLQFGRYILVGGSAFIVDFGSYCLLGLLGVHYLAAGVVSFIAGFAFNFFVSRLLIFKATAMEKANAKELLAVLLISLIGLILTEALLLVGTEIILMDCRVSKIIASIIVLFWNYFARRKFVYR